MQTIADELISKGIDPDSIIYLDLDKRGNRKIKTADQLEQLIDSKIQNGGFPRAITIDEEFAKRTYVTGVIQEIFNWKPIKASLMSMKFWHT